MNSANVITTVRIIAIPVFVCVYYLPFGWSHIIAALIFAIAAWSDWLDGYVARTWRQVSPLGEFLDPVADKLLVAVVLVLLVSEHTFRFLAIPAAIIVGREIVISALREWMAEIGKRASVAVTFVSKCKTVIQLLALMLLILAKHDPFSWIGIIGYISLYLAALMTLSSMVMYLKTAWPDLTLTAKE